MSFKQELTAAYHEMLNIKVSLGYKQRTYMSHILPFIEFCADSYPDAKEITKEMLDHWLLTKNFSADSTRRIAIINIRHFARFLNAIGKKAYIPPSEYNVKAQLYLPYIISGIVTVMMFYLMMFINNNPGLKSIPGSANLKTIMALGIGIITIFAYIFIFYIIIHVVYLFTKIIADDHIFRVQPLH